MSDTSSPSRVYNLHFVFMVMECHPKRKVDQQPCQLGGVELEHAGREKEQYVSVVQRFPTHYYCNCGCACRRSLNTVLDVLKWDLGNLLKGYHPLTRPDELPWHNAPPDNASDALAGSSCGFKALPLEARGDWPWYSCL